VNENRGALALVLHSHMPYVEGFGTWPFGEEWLWEAVACVYLPLIELLGDLQAPITVGLTPVLCDQLETLPGPAGDRLLAFLRDTRRSVHAEDSSGLDRTGQPELAAEVRRAADDYESAVEALRHRDLIGALARLDREGPLELWTSAATHALLPLLASEAGLRLQVRTGIAAHERRFGGWGGGLWLPECAYVPGLERGLADHGVKTVCVDQTAALGHGSPDQLEPVLTSAGVVAVPIDWRTVELVWNDRSGYPVHPTYRDYHRRTVHDLRPWNNAGGVYDPEAARALAREHARDFAGRCAERLDAYAQERGRAGLLTCALDTELLGHWWYEGQEWLRGVVEEAAALGLELVTVSDGVERAEPVERNLDASTWGTGKDFSTWDSPVVSDTAFEARRAELRTVAAAARRHEPREALERAARELLALQASDWAFQVTRDLAADYPLERVRAHAEAHDAALGALAQGGQDGRPEHQACGPEARTGYPPVVPDSAVRNLAPDLDLASLVVP
jgi:1,4-alpha-glucan branching enzyme